MTTSISLDRKDTATDSVSLDWNGTAGILLETHSRRGQNLPANTSSVSRLRTVGLDSNRAKKDAMPFDSLQSWVQGPGQDKPSVARSVVSHDSSVGRWYIDTTWTDPAFSSQFFALKIWEHTNTDGFRTRRDSFALDSGSWVQISTDSIERDNQNRPGRRLVWSLNDSSLFVLSEVVVYTWDNQRLSRAEVSLPRYGASYETRWWWSSSTRLDSVVYPVPEWNDRFTYDAHGNTLLHATSPIRYEYTYDSMDRMTSTSILNRDYSIGWAASSSDSFLFDTAGALAEIRHRETGKDSITRIAYGPRRPTSRIGRVMPPNLPGVRLEAGALRFPGVPGKASSLGVIRIDGGRSTLATGSGPLAIPLSDLPRGLVLWTLETPGLPPRHGSVLVPR